MNKIGLGTVQLGLEYGVSNTTGLPDRKAIDEIINCCLESKIDVIDTAISYGNSQRVLGSYNLDEFKLITKLPNAPIEKKNLNYWVKASVEESLRELNISRLYGLLLHNPKDLAYDYGEQIYKALLELKNENVIKKIGVSIYSPAELDVITKKYDIDLVQAPYNVFDRRIDESGWLDKLSNLGIMVHTRSVFLQGLLLMDQDMPKYFMNWDDLFISWKEWNNDNGYKPMESCLRFALQQEKIEKVIIGVQSAKQLNEIISLSDTEEVLFPEHISSTDLNLIDPSSWKLS